MHYENLASQAEQAAIRGEQSELYRITRDLSGKFQGECNAVKEKDGKRITIDDKQLQRWAEHFREVLKESQFLAVSNVKFILLLGALPPGAPTGLCPCTLLGASAPPPRPLACAGAFGPRYPHSHLLSKYHRLLQILLTALFTVCVC